MQPQKNRTPVDPTNHLLVALAVRELLSDPIHWTKGYYAKNKDGVPCQIFSSEAQSFCLRGARLFVIGELDPFYDYLDDESAFARFLGFEPKMIPRQNEIAGFNNNASHEEVLHLLDTAIMNARVPEAA